MTHTPMAPTIAQLQTLFTHPGIALAGALAVAIPIAIHLLTRFRRQPQPWGAMRFLLDVYRRHRARLRLEQLLLLALRCLLLLLLGLALAQPLVTGLAAAFTAQTPSRLWCLILDDSLSSRAIDPLTHAPRLDRLRSSALALVDAAAPADRFLLWRAASPAGSLSAPRPVLLDHAAARAALKQLASRGSRADIPAALAAAIAHLDTQPAPQRDLAAVVLLSDLSRAALPSDTAVAAASSPPFAAPLLVLPPAPPLPNIQITALTPRLPLAILTPGQDAASLPLDVRLRRLAEDLPPAVNTLHLRIPGESPSHDLAAAAHEVHWESGQSESTFTTTLIVPRAALGQASSVTLPILATFATGDGNALSDDDQRWTAIQLRARLRIGLAAPASSSASAALPPSRWISLALQPSSSSPIEVVPLSPDAITEAALASLDALLVPHPDQLPEAAWRLLHDRARRGLILWVFTPPEPGPAPWTSRLRDAFQLDWDLALDTQSAPSPAGWTLQTQAPSAPPLAPLASDWPALVQPLRVNQRLALRTAVEHDAWLRFPDGHALLAAAPVGEGHLLLLAAAIDPAWTNLPARPLLVALLHQTLRGLVSAQAAPPLAVVGDQPALPMSWDGAPHLAPPTGEPILLRRTQQGFTPIAPLDQPGPHAAPTTLGQRLLCVNIDPAAGDLRGAPEPQLNAWLSTLAPWRWLDAHHPLAAMSAGTAPRRSLAAPLLAIALVLLIVETVLARWFSHAHALPHHRGALAP